VVTDLQHSSKVILKVPAVSSYCELLSENPATQETNMPEPAKRERIESEGVEQNETILVVQVVWGGYSFNASPEQAAKQFVADLYEHLSRGGKVSVHVEGSDGMEHELQVTARAGVKSRTEFYQRT
jgi:hypothetical protein